MDNVSNNITKFLKLNDWSIIPEKNKGESPNSKKFEDLRYVYHQRIKGFCRPYVLAQRISWEIRSPIEVQVEPVEEYQLSCKEEELQSLGNTLNIDYWVKRGDVFLGLKPDGWFRLHQAKMNGQWHNLFIPNGERTFEWRLGWGLECTEDQIAMLLPAEGQDKIKVHSGILESGALNRFNEAGTGMSLAIEPMKKAIIKRNEVIAKLIIMPKSVPEIKSIIEERGIRDE